MRPSDISNLTVLIAPLDWGLGHATRCVPLIRQFIAQNCEVVFAGVQLQIDLIKKDFPKLKTEPIPGYEVHLDSAQSTYLQMLKQFRGIKRMSRIEHAIAQKLVEKYEVEIVLSDNRYGFYSTSATNILMTHQLNPQIPVFRKRVRNLIVNYISFFDHCWIPDVEDNPICGKLVNAQLKVPVHFIGYLSRFRRLEETKETIDVLFIVSGPEPERSRIQDVFIKSLEPLKNRLKFLLVTPNDTSLNEVVVNPSTEELERLLSKSKNVISRSGYTTIMELLELEKKAYLLPTKGQYEQEYLAEHIKHPLIKFIEEGEIDQVLEEILANN